MPACVPTIPAASPVDAPGFASALQVAESAFAVLVAEPDPLSLDGRLVGHGLPRRPIPLDELRAILLHPATTRVARDTAWRVLAGRARTAGPAWVVGAVGVAAPALRAASARLHRSGSGNADVQAELIAGFVHAVRQVDLAEDRVAARLCNQAVVAARAAARAEQADRAGRADARPGSACPPMPWGHPDLVLARAVAAGVVSARQAAVIGATRLEPVSLAAYAVRIGSSYEAVKRCRARGESRLVAALRDGSLTDPTAEVVRDATSRSAPDPARAGE